MSGVDARSTRVGASDHRFFAALLVMTLVVAVLWPLLDGGWHGDDWAWLAVAVHGGPPISAFVENHLFGFYYRPISVLVWWIATAVAGIEPSKHYMLTMALHAAGALAAGEFTRAFTGSIQRGALAAVLVAVAPPVAGMALWLSNRSEALVLVFGFLAMRLALGGTRHATRAVAVAITLWLAATSKETGLAFVPAVALLMVAETGWRGLLRPTRLLTVLVPLLLALLPRPFVTVPLPEAAGLVDLPRVAAGGMHFWIQRLPHALGGWGESGVLSIMLATLALVLAAIGTWNLLRDRLPWHALALCVLLALAALAQSPNTFGAVDDPAVLEFLVNLRYFAIGSAALAVLASCAIPREVSRPRDILIMAFAVALAMAWAKQSHTQATRWSAQTRVQTEQMLGGLAMTGSLPSCPPPFPSEAFPNALLGYVDTLYKANLPVGDPRLSCLVSVAGEPMGIFVLPRKSCVDVPTTGDWQVLIRDGRRFVEPLGGVCQVAYQRRARTLRGPVD